MNRLLEIPPEKLTPEQSTVFEQLTAGRGRILGPYKIWIHSPTVASGMEQIGTFLNKRSSLSPREVEIGILVIAQHWEGDYVRQAHIREGKDAGPHAGDHRRHPRRQGPQAHRSARARRPPLCRRARRAARNCRTPTSPRSKQVLGREGIAEVLVLLGYYTSVALGMKVHEVPIPQK